MIERTQISAVMAEVDTSEFKTPGGRNAARYDAVSTWLDEQDTVAKWIDGSEKDMILSDLDSYPEWESDG